MKRYLFTVIVVLMASFIVAQVRIDTPALNEPGNGDDNQMPNVFLNWDAVINAAEYEIQLSEDTVFNAIVVDEITDLTAWQTSNLKFNFEYFWRVRAIDKEGNHSPWSEVWSFMTFVQVELRSPSNGSDGEEPDLLLRWKDRISGTEISGVDHFDIEVDSTDTFDSPLYHVYSTAGNVFEKQMMFLRFGTNYKWRVRARHAEDASEWSEIRNFTTLDVFELKKPDDGATDQDLNVDLRWDNVSGIDRFDYQVDDSPELTSPTTYITENNIEPAQDLDYGETYYWRARARHEQDTTLWTEIWSFSTANAVELLSPPDGEDSVSVKPTLEWDQIQGSTEYEISYSTDETFAGAPKFYEPASDDEMPSYIILETLQKGTTYYWRIRAISETDTSDYSEAWSFITQGANSISEYFNQAQVSLFPNPAKDKINIQMRVNENTNIDFALIDLTGQTIISRQLNFSMGTNHEMIPVGDISNGIYMIKLSKGNHVYTNKMIINQ